MSVPKVWTAIFTQHMWVCQQDKFATFVSLEGIRNYTPGGGFSRNSVAAPPSVPCPLTTTPQGPIDPPSLVLERPFGAVQRKTPSALSFYALISFYPLRSSSRPWKRYIYCCFLPSSLAMSACLPKHPNFVPFVILFFRPSSNSFKVFTSTKSLHLFNFLGSELPHYPQALGHLQLSQLCHTLSSFCFCVHDLSHGAVDSARRCRLRGGRGMWALGMIS